MPEKILVVDDDRLIREALRIVLQDEGFEVGTAGSGQEALEAARATPFDLVICDIRMSGMDGIQTLTSIKDLLPETRQIVITGFADPDAPVQAIKLGVDEYLMKPFTNEQFLSAVKKSLTRFLEKRRYEEALKKRQKAFLGILQTIATHLESKDPYWEGHAARVTSLSVELGRSLGLPPQKAEQVRMAAPLHDLGKVSIREALLHQTEKLAEEEREEFKRLPQRAGEILAPLEELREVVTALVHQKEWFNGEGVPDGLMGEEIPVESRIIALAEAYDSLTHSRPYREAYSPQESLSLLKKEAGERFDPDLVSLLEKIIAEAYPEQEGGVEHEETSLQRRRWLLTKLGDSYREHAAGRQEALQLARKAYEEALSLSSVSARHRETDLPLPHDRVTLHALLGLGWAQAFLGQEKAALTTSSQLLPLTEEGSLQRGHALALSGYVRGVAGEVEEGKGLLEEALSLFSQWERKEEYGTVSLLLASLFSRSPSLIKEKETFGKYLNTFLFLPEPSRSFLAAKYSPPLDSAIRAAKEHGIAFPGEEESLQPLQPSPPLVMTGFGKFQVTVSGKILEERDWKTKKSKYLFAYLVSQRGKDVGEEKILDIFWPDSPMEKGRQSLYTAMTHIRNTLEPLNERAEREGAELIRSARGFYRFQPSLPYLYDVQEFETAVLEGNKAFLSGKEEEALPFYQNAESWYQGEFLEGYYGDWAQIIREQLNGDLIQILVRLTRYYQDKGKHQIAIEYGNKILEHDNCHQEGYLLLMKAFAGMGRAEEAVRLYYRCARVLMEELNLSPSMELTAYYMRCKG